MALCTSAAHAPSPARKRPGSTVNRDSAPHLAAEQLLIVFTATLTELGVINARTWPAWQALGLLDGRRPPPPAPRPGRHLHGS